MLITIEVEWSIILAIILEEQKKINEALADYNQIIKLDSNYE